LIRIGRAIREQGQAIKEHAEAYEKLAELDRLKSDFLSTVSHELRTPLNSILGWAQLMRSGKLDEEGSTRALGTIERNTKSLAQIIEDLLDVSRIITGKLRLEVTPIELEPVVAAALDTIRPASDAKNIQLQVSLDPSVGTISGDPNRLQQVVWNLLTNAIKFTPRGGHVKVRLERVESSACITVTDSGEGISQDFLPYIFDRFRQADSTFTRLHGGLGLGLAIVRHLVEMHGGSVSADSPGRGAGSTFSVSFPLAVDRWSSRVDTERPAHWHQPEAERDDADLTGLCVMIVDDEFDTRELLVAMLEQRGAEVISADSTADALEKLSRASNGSFPDVLVSDIGMPGLDGIDLITRVREMASDHGGNIPAIALTAYARDDDRTRVLKAGYQRHVAKPVEPSILASTIADLAHFVEKA
jgi:CheY-like chemotaxis protein